VVRILAQNRWPWRMHATYDETISRALDVFERVNRDIPLDGLQLVLRPCRDDLRASIDRIAALGGGIAVQHRMAYQGEYFVERYGAARAEPRRRSRACWPRASTCRPAPTRRAWRPTTPGCRSPG
jgi:predicted amidohydrolase YtcJ